MNHASNAGHAGQNQAQQPDLQVIIGCLREEVTFCCNNIGEIAACANTLKQMPGECAKTQSPEPMGSGVVGALNGILSDIRKQVKILQDLSAHMNQVVGK